MWCPFNHQSRVGSEERQNSTDDSYCLHHPHIKNSSSIHLLLASAFTLIQFPLPVWLSAKKCGIVVLYLGWGLCSSAHGTFNAWHGQDGILAVWYLYLFFCLWCSCLYWGTMSCWGSYIWMITASALCKAWRAAGCLCCAGFLCLRTGGCSVPVQ